MNEDLDTELLGRRVKSMYQAVAADPHGDFHFEMGREMAERLGHSATQMDAVPARRHLPDDINCDATLWAACIGGAMQVDKYVAATTLHNCEPYIGPKCRHSPPSM